MHAPPSAPHGPLTRGAARSLLRDIVEAVAPRLVAEGYYPPDTAFSEWPAQLFQDYIIDDTDGPLSDDDPALLSSAGHCARVSLILRLRKATRRLN